MRFNTSGFMGVTLAMCALAALTACQSKKPPVPVAEIAQPSAPSFNPPPPGAPVQSPPTRSNPLPPPATVGVGPGSIQDFVVNVGDRVYFDLDQHQVRDDARPVLDAQAAWLNRYPQVTVRIEGNADERGTREYNFALGSRRAESVRAYLVSRGVNAARIETVSFGKERPIDAASNEQAWQRNRNSHTAIVGGTQ